MVFCLMLAKKIFNKPVKFTTSWEIFIFNFTIIGKIVKYKISFSSGHHTLQFWKPVLNTWWISIDIVTLWHHRYTILLLSFTFLLKVPYILRSSHLSDHIYICILLLKGWLDGQYFWFLYRKSDCRLNNLLLLHFGVCKTFQSVDHSTWSLSRMKINVYSIFHLDSWMRLKMLVDVAGNVPVKVIARTFASGKTEKLVYQSLADLGLPSGKVGASFALFVLSYFWSIFIHIYCFWCVEWRHRTCRIYFWKVLWTVS